MWRLELGCSCETPFFAGVASVGTAAAACGVPCLVAALELLLARLFSIDDSPFLHFHTLT